MDATESPAQPTNGGGPDPDEIRIGISACLLGEEVRFDGGHKRDRFIDQTLGQFFTFVRVCPEVDIGLGTPRESLRLIRADGGVRMVAPKSASDHTEKMEEYARAKVEALRRLDLSGYLLKRASPSCGMERVRVYDENGVPERTGVGVFSRILMEEMPLLPVEEEGRLHDPTLRETFLDRVFGYHRMTRLFRNRWRPGDLVSFHTREKYLLLAHDPGGYTELGRLVADLKGRDRGELEAAYRRGYMETLAKNATTAKHVNVLQHMSGYLRDVVGEEERGEVRQAIEDYRSGFVPLIVPVTLIRHYARIHRVEWLREQHYLEPHPKELMVRNHV